MARKALGGGLVEGSRGWHPGGGAKYSRRLPGHEVQVNSWRFFSRQEVCLRLCPGHFCVRRALLKPGNQHVPQKVLAIGKDFSNCWEERQKVGAGFMISFLTGWDLAEPRTWLGRVFPPQPIEVLSPPDLCKKIPLFLREESLSYHPTTSHTCLLLCLHLHHLQSHHPPPTQIPQWSATGFCLSTFGPASRASSTKQWHHHLNLKL